MQRASTFRSGTNSVQATAKILPPAKLAQSGQPVQVAFSGGFIDSGRPVIYFVNI
jgi:hypothetical protein